jgi:hypothetical protein
MCSGTVRSELLPYSFHDCPDCSLWVQPIRAAAGTVSLVHVLVQHVFFFGRNDCTCCAATVWNCSVYLVQCQTLDFCDFRVHCLS